MVSLREGRLVDATMVRAGGGALVEPMSTAIVAGTPGLDGCWISWVRAADLRECIILPELVINPEPVLGRDYLPLSSRRPNRPESPIGISDVIADARISVAEAPLKDFLDRLKSTGMLQDAAVALMSQNDCLQPHWCESSGTNVLLLTCIPDMLQESVVVGHIIE